MSNLHYVMEKIALSNDNTTSCNVETTLKKDITTLYNAKTTIPNCRIGLNNDAMTKKTY